jgi:hypothetical protein
MATSNWITQHRQFDSPSLFFVGLYSSAILPHSDGVISSSSTNPRVYQRMRDPALALVKVEKVQG